MAMGKRKREGDIEKSSSDVSSNSTVGLAKKLKPEDALEKLLSLLNSEGSIIAGRKT